jgi:hypothetical protein
MIVHDRLDFEAGDTWYIAGDLTNTDGSALDISTALIEWRLIDGDGNAALLLNTDTGITVTNGAGGLCMVTVPGSATVSLPVGFYTDYIVVDINGAVSTQWSGPIGVGQNGRTLV